MKSKTQKIFRRRFKHFRTDVMKKIGILRVSTQNCLHLCEINHKNHIKTEIGGIIELI